MTRNTVPRDQPAFASRVILTVIACTLDVVSALLLLLALYREVQRHSAASLYGRVEEDLFINTSEGYQVSL